MSKQARECPNCGRPAIKDGNQIACEHCDAIFEVKATGARVKEVGRFEDLERRVTALEGKPRRAPDGKPKDGDGGRDAGPSGSDEGDGENMSVTFEDE